MSGPARKMVNLSIEETSGVDHPAHLQEGWLVMKAAHTDAVEETLEGYMPSGGGKAKRKPRTAGAGMKPTYKAEGDQEDPVDDEELIDDPVVDDESETVTEVSEEILKAAPEAVRKALTAMQKATNEAVAKAAFAESALLKERDDRADETSILKARDQFANLGLDAEMVGPALRRLAAFDADLAKSIEGVLVSADAKVESADIFAEIGKSASGTVGSAFEQATSLAKAAVSDGRSDTFAQALTDVFSAQPDLYSQYLIDQQGK
jgi:hypothetical protein